MVHVWAFPSGDTAGLLASLQDSNGKYVVVPLTKSKYVLNANSAIFEKNVLLGREGDGLMECTNFNDIFYSHTMSIIKLGLLSITVQCITQNQ